MVIFWDTSALLPLVFEEEKSDNLSQLFVRQTQHVCWALTPVEIHSALSRRLRQNEISELEFDGVWQAWQTIEKQFFQVKDILLVRDRAYRILRTHILKAADAMQLAAAIIATKDQPQGHVFVTQDQQLAHAAKRENFILA